MAEATDLSRTRTSVDQALGLPNAHYIDPAVYEEERQALLFANWAGVGFGGDIPEPGDVMAVDFAGLPILLVRDHDGGVKVYQNTCRHRGMILIQEKKNVRGTIRCPYHSWCYGLNGQLRSTPHAGGPGNNLDPNVKREELGLIEIRSHFWHDIIFVNVSGDAPSFEVANAKLLERWKEFEQPHYFGGSDSYFPFDVACNWKFAVENYCESYHLPFIHPGLNSWSRLEDHYHIEEPGFYSGQGSYVYRQIEGEGGAKFPDFKDLSDKWNTGAEYVVMYPNVMLGTHRDHAFAIILMPQGPERTIERNAVFYPFDPAERPELKPLMDKNAAQWKSVLEEDLFVIEGMQKGRHGIYFDGGKFAPVMDSPTHVFHKWVADQVAEYREAKIAAQ